jgi:hypothetical protein
MDMAVEGAFCVHNGMITMDEREQGWWSQTLRDIQNRMESLDNRLRGVEQAFKNGISETLDTMNQTLTEMRAEQKSLRERVSKIEDEQEGRRQVKSLLIRYAGLFVAGAGLMFTAMRIL